MPRTETASKCKEINTCPWRERTASQRVVNQRHVVVYVINFNSINIIIHDFVQIKPYIK